MEDQTNKPGRPGIDEAVYHQQIEAWLAAGRPRGDITAGALVKAVGGRHPRVNMILMAYWEAHPEEAPVPRQMGEQLKSVLEAAAGSIWEALQDETDIRVAAIETTASELVAEAVRDAAAARLEAQHAQAEINQLNKRVDEKTVALNKATDRADDLEADLKTARGAATEMASQVQQYNADLAVCMAGKRRAQTDIDTLGKDNKDLTTRLAGATEQNIRHETQINMLREQLAELKAAATNNASK